MPRKIPASRSATTGFFAASRQVLNAAGQEVPLTTAEYNILHVLARHKGQVLCRDEIIALSKGRDWRCYERSVDGLISRLRRKLQPQDGTSHFIKTVHGTGYTIAPL
ncbi:MAG: Response regulators consisting of a CheY-like receiver domain and a winged-helix DNA-binding domain [Rhodobacteraceae bacterium HLUCCA12]|nr:MAG: Response regulators consisting of a CheY-like receiver domain and a winged-helix DNA-binding domain [Rhodobacteraceae bacterium HLUCCA12]